MKFSENWLRHYVHTSLSSAALLERLTAIGLEVESVEDLDTDMSDVVIAQVEHVECDSHSENVRSYRVHAGQYGDFQIAAGVDHLQPGQRVAIALPGAPVTRQSSCLSAETSTKAIFCPQTVLGSFVTGGVIVLDAQAPVGQPVARYLDLPDRCIEVSLTPNRADCLGVRGIAYDIAAACHTVVEPLHLPVPEVVQIPSEQSLAFASPVPDACAHYAYASIVGINASVRTPDWMVQRLLRSGIQPLHFLVDVTQYVMLALGQPLHAYDRQKLHGSIGVRFARPQEMLTLVDKKTVTLDPSILVVTDNDHAIALAGIMGGWETRVTTSTSKVVLEAAHYAPSAVMGKARALGIHSEAAYRFERGVDPQLPVMALQHAIALITTYAGGEVHEYYPSAASAVQDAQKQILLRRTRITRILGISFEDDFVEATLHGLGMHLVSHPLGWLVTAPSRRFDITIEDDLVEELARMYGYDKIPTKIVQQAAVSVRAGHCLEHHHRLYALRRHAAARNFQEVVTFSFIDAQRLGCWGREEGRSVTLSNPLSAEWAVMRPSLLPGLLRTLSYQCARQMDRVRIFEIGSTFESSGQASAPLETLCFAAMICGDVQGRSWAESRRPVDFFDMKGDLEAFVGRLGGRISLSLSTRPWFHPGRSADVLLGEKVIGCIGQIHPKISHEYDVEAEVYAFEMRLAPAIIDAHVVQLRTLSRFPLVRRDIALLLPESVCWEDLASTMRGAAGPFLRDVELFDRYQGKGIEPGYQSMAIGLVFQHDMRTLTDSEVESALLAVTAAVSNTYSARIRS